jgi:uroporphyrinogen-III synthase
MLTVGPQSLAAARQAGFGTSQAQGGDVEGLARHIGDTLDPAHGPILYLSGAETTGDLEVRLTRLGFAVDRVVVYDAVAATSLSGAGIADHDGVLLYSPRTARIWVSLAGETARLLHHYCLSENVAAVLPAPWRKSVAMRPDEAAMLALLDHNA